MDGAHRNHVIILMMPLNSLMLLLEIDRKYVSFQRVPSSYRIWKGDPCGFLFFPFRGPKLMAILLGRAP